MARRRKPAASGWSSKTYKSPLWKYAHPVRHLKGQARRARRQMTPTKVLGRYFNVREIKSTVGTRTTRVTEDTRRRQAAASEKKAAAAAKRTAKRADPYADALKIPERNRKTATAMAKAQQPAKKTVAVRKKDGSGRFDGRQAMRSDDRAAYERAQQPPSDPSLFARNLRGRRTPPQV